MGSHKGHHAATSARAMVSPLSKGRVRGVAEFSGPDCGCSTRVSVQLSGLTPNQLHGIHIHENGDCSALDGSSAGGHYNPTGAAHGGPESDAHHSGDLGNIMARADGQATLEINLERVAVSSLVGRSIVVHANPDDLKSQPSGNSGDRIACGVIGVSKGK